VAKILTQNDARHKSRKARVKAKKQETAKDFIKKRQKEIYSNE
jgi:hypothetical protein